MQELDIHDEVAAFLKEQPTLIQTKENPWVVFAEAAYKERFGNFEDAYEYAMGHFPVGRFLIRNILAAEPFIPMMYVTK